MFGRRIEELDRAIDSLEERFWGMVGRMDAKLGWLEKKLEELEEERQKTEACDLCHGIFLKGKLIDGEPRIEDEMIEFNSMFGHGIKHSGKKIVVTPRYCNACLKLVAPIDMGKEKTKK